LRGVGGGCGQKVEVCVHGISIFSWLFSPRFLGRACLVLAKTVTGHCLPLLLNLGNRLGVGIPHGMDFAQQAELWKKTMQFECFNPVNSHIGQP
jgi:hypothetical protein